MQPIRKFYAADPAGGGPQGPSDRDVNNAEHLKDTFARLKTDLVDIAALLKTELTAGIAGFDRASKKAATESIRSLEGELRRAAKAVDKTRQSQEGLTKQFTSSKKIQESINAIKSRQASIDSTILQLERQGLAINQKQQAAIDRATAALNEQVGIEEQLLEKSLKVEKSIGNLGKLFQGLTKIPIVGQLIDADSVLAKMKKKGEETGSKWEAFGAGMKEVFSSIGRSLMDPATIITGIFTALKGIFDLAVRFDAKTYDIAKNVGVTVTEAESLQKSFVDIANSSKNFGLTSTELSKTYAELTNSLGFMVPANDAFLETATLIQKRTGASAEDMNALSLQATLSGKTLEETMGTLEASRNIEGAKSKLMLSQKQILDGIAKTSSAVLINFKGNVGALSDAIIRATKLGTSLDQINKQGESLLDFESSISKEFEAQLLTGRDINLTHARDLALQGKTGELMDELSRQQVSYDSFMNDSVIARKAEAEAVGLSVEELTKQLLLQKQANELGAKGGQSAVERYNELVKSGLTQTEIAKKLGSEQEAADLAKASMQDKFQATIEKLKDTLGSIVAGPVGDMVEEFGKFISKSENIKMIADGIKSVFQGIASAVKSLPAILSAIIPVAKVIGGLLIANAAASMISSLAAIPVVGPALGIAAAAGAVMWLSSLMSGSASGPPSVPTGGGGAAGMTPPLNPATTAATQATQAATTAAPAPIFKFNVNTNVGTENWSKQSRTAIQEDPGTSLQ